MKFLNLDIKGFAQSMKIDPFGAVHEVVIKYLVPPVASLSIGDKVTPWLDKFKEVTEHDRFIVIVADDARYDAFSLIYKKYLNGSLTIAKVPPPHTYGWLPKAFSIKNFDNVRVFYGSLGIPSHDIKLDRFIPKDRNIDIYKIRPEKLKNLKTVHPSEINDFIRRVGLSGRDLIWYVQPHFPWICNRKLSIQLMKDVLVHDFIPPDNVRRSLKKLKVSKAEVIKAYLCNLGIALKGIADLLEYIKLKGVNYDKIIVTSDHGEMLGEYGLFLHQEYELPQLTLVPWLEVKI